MHDSHHSNISVVLITQNYFEKSRFNKTFHRQFSERVLFYDRCDALQLSIISRQIFPGKASFLHSVFKWIYKYRAMDPLKYVLIDASTITSVPFNMIVRTAIFPKQNQKAINPIFFFPEGTK